MKSATSLRRRAWLCALAVAIVTAALAAPAQGALEGSSSISLDNDVHWWSMANVVSNGTYQWTAYWDALEAGGEIHAQVSRRRLSDDRVDTVRFDGTGGTTSIGLNNVNDAHDYLQVGISPNDGRLHISWSDHHGRHYYARSAERCLTAASFTQESCRFVWLEYQTEQRDREGRSEVRTESIFTYPTYSNDSRGRLYMAYRFGSSSRGTHYLNSYDETTGRWTSRGKVLWGRIDSETRYRSAVPATYEPPPGRAATEETSSERGPYIWGWSFDKNDHLQISWSWREHLSRNVDYFHDYYYAYSDDYGRTWRTYDDRALGTSGTDPITILDEQALIQSAPPGALPGGAQMAYDSDNRPHIVASMNEGATVNAPVDSQTRLRHIWLGTDRAWYSTWIGSPNQQDVWGELVIDGADNLNYVYNKTLFDWIPVWEYPWTQLWLSSDLVTWQSDGERRGHLAVTQKSEITCLDTREMIGTSISERGNSQVRLRVQNRTDAREMELFFTTTADRVWSSEKRTTVAVTPNEGSYREVLIDLSGNRSWNGTLRRLELCMNDSSAEAGDEFNLDWVRVTDNRGTAAKSWEFDEVGAQLHIATVSSANNWQGEWSIRSLLPEVSETWSDSGHLVDRPRYAETGRVTVPMLTQGAPGNERMELREYRVTSDTIRKQWGFDISGTDWTAANHVSELRWASDGGVGTLQGTITNNDSAIDSAANIGVRLSARTVELSMKSSVATTAMLCWTTSASRTWSINRCSASREVRANGRYNAYTFETRGWRDWESRQTLYQLRLEPSDSREVRGGTFNVDSIKLID